ncbi:hypothetical protein [Falsiroseomonas sp. E2-1-a4]|uniref:hypothetical protein n=1 Tax=Falsiroseomonas sp. E2-1-a4 TaxID=3239299 RepID=UPI003F341068
MAGFGSINAHVFGPRDDFTRSLFWVLRLGFEVQPDASEAQDAIQAVNCDWMTFPIQDWRRLDGCSAADFVRPSLVECSFYMNGEHFLAGVRSLSIEATSRHAEFCVSLDIDVPCGDDLDPLPPLHFDAVVRFESCLVVPENLHPKVENEAEAAALLAGFTDLASLATPVWDRFRFVFKPWNNELSPANPN